MHKRIRHAATLLPLLTLMLGACSTGTTGPAVQASRSPATRQIAQARPSSTAVPMDSVEVHDTSKLLPRESVSVAQCSAPDSLDSRCDDEIAAIYRAKIGRLGAKLITVERSVRSRRRG